MKNRKKKCYLYTRVSTSMQVDGYSLDAQRDKLIKYAEYQDMEVAGEYTDEGCSGKNIKGRVSFQQMMSDIESGRDGVSFVLVFKLSRFGRNVADVLNSLQTMQDFGVNLICVEDGIDSSKDAGKLMISVLSAVAEIERENILIQTMEGRKQKAREGRWNGGFAPYGYKLENGELFIAEDEAEVIRIIFDKYIHTTMGVNGIANYLNNQGIKKKKRQNNTIDGFAASFVKGVLDNPIYMGKMPYGRRKTEKIQGTRNEYHVVKADDYELYEGVHEAIISEEDWNFAHCKRMENGVKHEKTHSLGHAHILSCILKCPECGAPLYGNVNRKRKKDGTYYKDTFYYGCKHSMLPDGHKCTYKKQWRQDLVNAAVEELILKMVNNEAFKEAMRKKIGNKLDTDEIDREKETCMARIKQAIVAKDKLAAQMDHLNAADPLYDRKYQDMQDRLDSLYQDIADAEYDLELAEQKLSDILKDRITEENAYKLLFAYDKIYKKATDAEKKELMNAFIERIELYPEPLENGKFIKYIGFRFPIFYEGNEVREICLENETTDETVVLLSREKVDGHIEIDLDVEKRKNYNVGSGEGRMYANDRKRNKKYNSSIEE